MALTADGIIAKVRGILQDPYPGLVWGNDELEGWINAAQNSIANYIPGTTAMAAESFPVRQGSRQVLPAGAARLIRMIGNVDHALSGNDRQRESVIRLGRFDDLEITYPNWRSATRKLNGGFQYYFYDIDAPLYFYLYPTPLSTWDGAGDPPVTAERINLIYSQAPEPVLWRETGEAGMIREISGDQVTIEQATLMIPDAYESAVIDYVLFRAWQRPPHTPGRLRLSQQREQAFLTAVQGARGTDELAAIPDSESPDDR